MRLVVTWVTLVLSSAAVLACEIGPQANVKLDAKDQEVMVSLGKAINALELLKGTPVAAALFSRPSTVLTLTAADGRALAQALAGLRKATACHADGVTMERILSDDTPGIRFLRAIEGCLADACVDNK